MRLRDLLGYKRIVIQCHDNPDADAIASGYGLYTYFKEKGKDVRFVYSGRFVIKKSNLVLMINELEIPIEYVKSIELPDLLVMADCQYGEGNVTKFEAREIAVIDHHQVTGTLPKLSDVRSTLGSCSTLVRELLSYEGIDINDNINLATALYYGLMMDTNHFSEIYHPLDKDLRDDAIYDKSKIRRFRNANISLDELKIAGEALCGYDYDDERRYAVIKARPCDPNILGIIADMMLEVDAVDYCVVYSILPFGIKISVRSCRKDTRASELADFITEKVGSGGGHIDKAGGFVSCELLQSEYSIGIDNEKVTEFFKMRMNEYFDESEIINANEYKVNLQQMRKYRRRNLRLGYVKVSDIFNIGTKITIRTLDGDLHIIVEDGMYIIIGIKGEIFTMSGEDFSKSYDVCDEPFDFNGEYEPTVKFQRDEKNISLIPFAKTCMPFGSVEIYAKRLDHRVKLFSSCDDEDYMLGRTGDYLAVRRDNPQDVYVIEGDLFRWDYEEMGEIVMSNASYK